MARAMALALPVTDLEGLRRRVAALAEPRPAVYRMMDPTGRVIYVGKAKRLRTRLLSYFRASYPEDKGARILHTTADITWQYVPSDFAAYLGELRAIRQFRPAFNVKLNRVRRATFIKVSSGAAPKVYHGSTPGRSDEACYGPFRSPARVAQGLRILNDLLGLRDCAVAMPIVFAEQGDLFAPARRAACLRHELGACSGPCAGFVSAAEYARRIDTARAFLEGRAIAPVDRAVDGMLAASEENAFETAARWRQKYEHLEWLLAATARARAAVDFLTFVYRDPGEFGDDRAYLIRRGVVRASFPFPTTPIEIEAFRAAVREETAAELPGTGPLPADDIDEILLLLSWFRRVPEALRRTTPLEEWTQDPDGREGQEGREGR